MWSSVLDTVKVLKKILILCQADNPERVTAWFTNTGIFCYGNSGVNSKTWCIESSERSVGVSKCPNWISVCIRSDHALAVYSDQYRKHMVTKEAVEVKSNDRWTAQLINHQIQKINWKFGAINVYFTQLLIDHRLFWADLIKIGKVVKVLCSYGHSTWSDSCQNFSS